MVHYRSQSGWWVDGTLWPTYWVIGFQQQSTCRSNDNKTKKAIKNVGLGIADQQKAGKQGRDDSIKQFSTQLQSWINLIDVIISMIQLLTVNLLPVVLLQIHKALLSYDITQTIAIGGYKNALVSLIKLKLRDVYYKTNNSRISRSWA